MGTHPGLVKWVAVGIGFALVCGPPRALAVERRLDQLPGDVFDMLLVWTEPIKQVAQASRRLDPVTALWIGLVDGSIKSIERSTRFILFQDGQATSSPQEPGEIFRYSF